MKFFKNLKLQFKAKLENYNSKKSSVRKSEQCSSMIGDSNMHANGDINLNQEDVNAYRCKKDWDRFAHLFSDQIVSWMIKIFFHNPSYDYDREQNIKKWITDIENAAEKLPISKKDPKAKNLIKIVEEAKAAIASYVKHQKDIELQEKFMVLFNSITEIRDL